MLERLDCARYLWEERWMLLGRVRLRNSSLELSLERFDCRPRPFGTGIINEVLLA